MKLTITPPNVVLATPDGNDSYELLFHGATSIMGPILEVRDKYGRSLDLAVVTISERGKLKLRSMCDTPEPAADREAVPLTEVKKNG